MIDAKFVDAIRDLANAAKQPITIPIKGQRDCVYMPGEDGLYEVRTNVPDRRNLFFSLETLVDAGLFFEDSNIWYSRVGIMTENGLADRNTLPLKLSPALTQLQSFEQARTPLKQDDIVLLLRTTFRDLVAPSDLLARVSSVNFKLGQDASSAVAQGSRSVSKSMVAQLECRGEIPDTIVFDVPIWENGGAAIQGITARVLCAFHVDAQTTTFAILPIPGGTERAIAEGEAELEQLIRNTVEKACGTDGTRPKVYHGTPTGD